MYIIKIIHDKNNKVHYKNNIIIADYKQIIIVCYKNIIFIPEMLGWVQHKKIY